MKYSLNEALKYLGTEFDQIEWKYAEVPSGSYSEKMQLWPGDENEDIMICVYKGTTLSIEEIAIILGYNNSSNFYRTFKNYYGQSPRDYLLESHE